MRKNLKYYLSLNYPISVETYTENGETGYALEIPDLPGCGASGKTVDEAMKNLEDAKELWISASLKRKLPIPEPVSEDDFSGKFLLRIPTKLHMALAKQAKKTGVSLNQYVKSVLELHMALSYQQETTAERDKKLLQEIKLTRQKLASSTEEEMLTNVSSATSTSIIPLAKAEGF